MVNEEKIKINGDVELGATIAYANKEEKRPLILLIAGTGNLDRDGNNKTIKLNIYKDLSDFFVNQGCICVRYDKRGTHTSGGNIKTHTLTNLVNDAQSIIEYCKTLPYVDEDRIIVCGHSEGAMIATLLTEKIRLDGLILLSGAGTSLKEAMYYQNERIIDEAENGKGFINYLIKKTVNRDKVSKQLEGIFDKANKSKKDIFFYRGSIMPTKYIQEHGELRGVDFVEKLKKYTGKILAITGTGDIQANYRSLQQLENIENIEIYTPEGVNHILREIDDNNSMITYMKQYKRLSKTPLHKPTTSRISNWLHTHFTKTQELEK